jgi:hypothetical protein
VLGAVSIGVGVPVYAVIFQQKKTASGWDDAYILETYFQQHLVKLKAWTSFYLGCCLIGHFLTISCNLVSCDLV